MEHKEYSYLVSVVIATYNRPQLLKKTIASVRAQTISDIEIIVVDDHSTEDMFDVISQFDTVKFIRHEKNKGACAARNTGILNAQGKYIAFLDDDDAWLPEKIERQLNTLKYFQACLCGYKDNNDKLYIQKTDHISLAMLSLGNSFCGSSGLICERELILTELFDETLPNGQDWDIYIRLAKKCMLGYVAEPLFVYNKHAGETITNKAQNISISEINKRLVAINKHRDIMGERLFKRRLANGILTYIGSKKNKLAFLFYSIKRAGLEATLHVLLMKILRQS